MYLWPYNLNLMSVVVNFTELSQLALLTASTLSIIFPMATNGVVN